MKKFLLLFTLQICIAFAQLIDLSNGIKGNLGVSHLNSGTNADSGHYWAGDGIWRILPSGSVTSVTGTCGIYANITTTGAVSLAQDINNQTGTTYVFVNGDCGKIITFNNAGAVSVTLPQAGSGGNFLRGWPIDVQNYGAGTVTITPTVSTIGGAASLILTTGQGGHIVSNGTNYETQLGKGGGGSGATFFTQLLDNWNITRTSATRLTVGSNCAISTPCSFKVGTKVYQFTAPITIDIAATTAGFVYIYGDSSGVIGVGIPSSGFNLTACTGCTIYTGITQFPNDSAVQIGSWNATANTWDANVSSKNTTPFSGPFKFIAGSGINLTPTQDSLTITNTGSGLTPAGFYLTTGGVNYCGQFFQVCTPASGLSFINTQGSSSLLSIGGTQVLKSALVAANNGVLVGKSILIGNTSATIAISCLPFPDTNTVQPICGVGFSDGTKMITIYQYFTNSNFNGQTSAYQLAYWSTQTNIAASLTTSFGMSQGPGSSVWWVKLVCSVAGCGSGNLTIQASSDGVNFSQGYTEAVGTHLTPTSWGILGSPSSTSNDLYVNILSFLVQ